MAAKDTTCMGSDTLESYDILIAGAGATGCIVAARVAEADPSLKILVIEVGGSAQLSFSLLTRPS